MGHPNLRGFGNLGGFLEKTFMDNYIQYSAKWRKNEKLTLNRLLSLIKFVCRKSLLSLIILAIGILLRILYRNCGLLIFEDALLYPFQYLFLCLKGIKPINRKNKVYLNAYVKSYSQTHSLRCS